MSEQTPERKGQSEVWVMWVCPECGSAISGDAAGYVPPEFMRNCRHPMYPDLKFPPDVGRNVERERVEVVRA